MFVITSLALLLVAPPVSISEAARTATDTFTRADTLRGSNTPERAWWDVLYYNLDVQIDPDSKTISGRNTIVFKVVSPPPRDGQRAFQVDLQSPLGIDSVIAYAGARNTRAGGSDSRQSSNLKSNVDSRQPRKLKVDSEGNAHFVSLETVKEAGKIDSLVVYYSGTPIVAKNAPWDGGIVWSKDKSGNPWIASAVQGLGASAWWPNKDAQFDEPDSQQISISVPDPLVAVSNGRLRNKQSLGNSTTKYTWFVSNPINNYGVALNIGVYANYSEKMTGEGGELDISYWPLVDNLEKAKAQFVQTKPMLACFESWFGPYPFYADGFKIVETPHLGMEHQSAVAYGNGYANGYRGRDLSGTGWGLKWDFILIHESGHEWFGNNITTADIADMWVHESFTNYSEGLYTECMFGKQAGAEYIVGLRKAVRNDVPVISAYGVNKGGSGDMYYKGSNMLHTIRTIIDNDSLWREILRGLNKDFNKSIVTGRQVQEYINNRSGKNFDKVFQQYLTTTVIPTLEWKWEGDKIFYRWKGAVEGFDMPVKVYLSEAKSLMLKPTFHWQEISVPLESDSKFKVDVNFYVEQSNVKELPAVEM